ncbi:MAG: ClbS/DfsB family four-helix bundle protein [Caldilineaceae bacterium]|nr:ClbS/DfsB family four-helix bundle protein [Caldilineaceae bacterium]
MEKQRFLQELQAENAQWEALLQQISASQMEEPTVAGGWSIKDIVAHLTGWRKRSVARLQAFVNGNPNPAPPWPEHLQSDDAINDWIYAQNRDRSVNAVLDDSRQTFVELVAALDTLPAVAFRDPNYLPWMEGEPLTAAAYFAHFHEEHEPDIRAWLAQQRETKM